MKDVGTKKYLAELTTVQLPSLSILEQEWEKLYKSNEGFAWDGRCYLPENKYTNFFKDLINQIKTEVNYTYKDLCLQFRQINHPKCALMSHIIHKDSYRKSMIVFPVSTITDPVCFYTDEMYTKNKNNQHKNKPDLMSFYSHKHPVLMDTQKWHNVFVIDKSKPRILIQLEYDYTFDEIFFTNTDKFQLL